jgi:hypothetical protein
LKRKGRFCCAIFLTQEEALFTEVKYHEEKTLQVDINEKFLLFSKLDKLQLHSYLIIKVKFKQLNLMKNVPQL